MIENIASMFKPNSEPTLDYVQEVMERTLQLVQTQMDVTENIYNEVSQEYRELLTAAEPSAMLQGWPKMLESTTRNVSEGAAVYLKNAVNFQNEMLQMMHDRMPELSRQAMGRLIETTRAAITPEEVSAPRASRQSNAGRSGGVSARKAA